MKRYGGPAALLAILAAVPGCGPRHAEAPRGAHPPNGAVSVPYPPPPAKVEEVPAQPHAACVWADGYWDFSDRWEWQAGEWVVPQPHCRLAPMELRRQGGLLLHARPRWYPDNVTLLGVQSACPRPPACRQIPTKMPSAHGPGSSPAP
jgi:hypothetical protein